MKQILIFLFIIMLAFIILKYFTLSPEEYINQIP